MTPDAVAALIDHTLLKPEATRTEIEALCREAVEFGFATVCINPTWVALAAGLLAKTPVLVSTVVGFPFGATTAEVKAYEAQRALADRADEIDMVINIGALRSGDLETVRRDVEGVTTMCRLVSAKCKVIIEAALLTREEKIAACTIAKEAGAHFVKTSTGFGAGGATLADVALIHSIVGNEMGIKAAGGIRDFLTVKGMVGAGATRIGTSAGVQIVQEARAQAHA